MFCAGASTPMLFRPATSGMLDGPPRVVFTHCPAVVSPSQGHRFEDNFSSNAVFGPLYGCLEVDVVLTCRRGGEHWMTRYEIPCVAIGLTPTQRGLCKMSYCFGRSELVPHPNHPSPIPCFAPLYSTRPAPNPYFCSRMVIPHVRLMVS